MKPSSLPKHRYTPIAVVALLDAAYHQRTIDRLTMRALAMDARRLMWRLRGLTTSRPAPHTSHPEPHRTTAGQVPTATSHADAAQATPGASPQPMKTAAFAGFQSVRHGLHFKESPKARPESR